MKSLKKIAELSKSIKCKDRATWIQLYYSVEEDAVYTEDNPGRYFMTNLINPNTENDIVEAVTIGLNS